MNSQINNSLGSNWSGATCCATGTCSSQNPYYYQCVATSGATNVDAASAAATQQTSTVAVQQETTISSTIQQEATTSVVVQQQETTQAGDSYGTTQYGEDISYSTMAAKQTTVVEESENAETTATIQVQADTTSATSITNAVKDITVSSDTTAQAAATTTSEAVATTSSSNGVTTSAATTEVDNGTSSFSLTAYPGEDEYADCTEVYATCGGSAYSGPTCCYYGSYCSTVNEAYAQCSPTSIVNSVETAAVTQDGAASSSRDWYYGRGTYWGPSDGNACQMKNGYNDESMVVAIGIDTYEAGNLSSTYVSDYCGRKIRAWYGEKYVDVTVIDACGSCDKYSLDFSPSAFNTLASSNDGVIGIVWTFTDE